MNYKYGNWKGGNTGWLLLLQKKLKLLYFFFPFKEIKVYLCHYIENTVIKKDVGFLHSFVTNNIFQVTKSYFCY